MKKIFLLFAFAFSSIISFGQHGTFTDVRLVNGDSTISGTNNGTIFYNRVSNKFRFRQNGAWASYILSGSGLMASNNLSDVANKSTSQLNLFPTATALQGLRKNAGNTAWETYNPIFTASNGLTVIGNDVQIGGSGVTNTTLPVAAGYFSIFGNAGGSTSAYNVYRNGGANNSQLLFYSESAANVGTYFSMDHDNQLGFGNGAIFTDTRLSKRGFEYGGTGYVKQLHSLTDKEYVDKWAQYVATYSSTLSTSNTAAQNSTAFTDLVTNTPSGGSIIIPPGVYLIDSISIRKPVTITGFGAKFNFASNTRTKVNIKANNVRIYGIIFNGDGIAGTAMNGISIDGYSGISIENCILSNINGQAIVCRNSLTYPNLLATSKIFNNSLGVLLYEHGDVWSITNNSIHDNTFGLEIAAIACIVSSNQFQSNNRDLLFRANTVPASYPSGRNVISGNSFTTISNIAIDADGNSNGNFFYNNQHIGGVIRVVGANEYTFSNNSFENVQFQFGSSCVGTQLINNHISSVSNTIDLDYGSLGVSDVRRRNNYNDTGGLYGSNFNESFGTVNKIMLSDGLGGFIASGLTANSNTIQSSGGNLTISTATNENIFINPASTGTLNLGTSGSGLVTIGNSSRNITTTGNQININGNGSITITSGTSNDLTLSAGRNVVLPLAVPLKITEGTDGRIGQTTLVSGTKAITVNGVTTSSRCFTQRATPSGASLTVQYDCACTTNTVTIQADLAATTINTADGSTLNYIIYN